MNYEHYRKTGTQARARAVRLRLRGVSAGLSLAVSWQRERSHGASLFSGATVLFSE